MSTWLYRLGRAAFRHRVTTLVGWLVLLVLLGGTTAATGGALEDSFTIPGTESQRGMEALQQRFPQAAGTTAQIVFVAEGGQVADDDAAAVIEQVVAAAAQAEHVTLVSDPLEPANLDTQVSDDGRYAQSTVQLDVAVVDLPQSTVDALEEAATVGAGSPVEAHLGGQIYAETGVALSITEVLGVVVAVLVLALTFGSVLAAGMPLMTALLGVVVSMAGILTAAAFTDVSTTTPTLALMIGLAVGIDYALFILSRHRHQLAQGMDAEESAARATATAGGAVVFAGTTVIIALCGLAVVNIPFLTVMGVAAAGAVAVAVLVALTALPAIMGLAGERLRPKPSSRAARRETADPTTGATFGARWVHLVTRRPWLTVGMVVVGVGMLAIPATDLRLTLPDNGSAPAGSPQRVTYDLISEGFGPGYNDPLMVTADIIGSLDPLTDVQDLADDIAQIDGVVAVPLATPNETADTALIQVVPADGQSAQSTQDLVAEIRSRADDLVAPYDGVRDLVVTGYTAAGIDVSARLGDALVPFGLVVVGLSLVLLLLVFRSIAVPLKATLGYLLSVGASFGVTAAVFEWGWGASLIDVARVGPVISFMPIIVMGVLFGLAMDYEVFLVSRMHEEYTRTRDPRRAVQVGFASSARVVTAAAVIMISVFVAFVPHGSDIVKPIALGLAVGVFVDAFLVRMTLVPAVLVLLGHRAWSLPRWLDRRLPALDVEGAGLEEQLAHDRWTAEHGATVVHADALVLATPEDPDRPATAPVSFALAPGDLVAVRAAEPRLLDALALTVSGRTPPAGGRLAVLDRPLPAQAAAVAARVALVTAPATADQDRTVGDHLAAALATRTWSPARRSTLLRRTLRTTDWLLVGDPDADLPHTPPRVRAGTPLAALAADRRTVLDLALAAGSEPGLLVLDLPHPPGPCTRTAVDLLVGRGSTVLVTGPGWPGARTVDLHPAGTPAAPAGAPAAPDGPPAARPTDPAAGTPGDAPVLEATR